MTECVRVLTPDGHLVVADLVVPGWIATTTAHLVTRQPATAEALRRVAGAFGLRPIHESGAVVAFHAAWQRAQ